MLLYLDIEIYDINETVVNYFVCRSDKNAVFHFGTILILVHWSFPWNKWSWLFRSHSTDVFSSATGDIQLTITVFICTITPGDLLQFLQRVFVITLLQDHTAMTYGFITRLKQFISILGSAQVATVCIKHISS